MPRWRRSICSLAVLAIRAVLGVGGAHNFRARCCGLGNPLLPSHWRDRVRNAWLVLHLPLLPLGRTVRHSRLQVLNGSRLHIRPVVCGGSVRRRGRIGLFSLRVEPNAVT